MASTDGDGYSITSMRVKTAFWDEVKIFAIKEHVSVTELVETALREHMKRHAH